jgi:hypothetical protein
MCTNIIRTEMYNEFVCNVFLSISVAENYQRVICEKIKQQNYKGKINAKN